MSDNRTELVRVVTALAFEVPEHVWRDARRRILAAFDDEVARVRAEAADVVRTTHVELGDHLGGHRGLSPDREALAVAILSKGDQ